MNNKITQKPKVIFFGNGALADAALAVISKKCDIIFHAHTREDLPNIISLKKDFPEAHGILASFGVMIKSDVLDVFEPEGILNIHPSLLPLYRGASPIESAILAGDTDFSVSIMKLVKAMDAGPIYHQITLSSSEIASLTNTTLISDLIPSKSAIYSALATSGAEWICTHLSNLPTPVAQDNGKATFTTKLDKSMSFLDPTSGTADQTLRKIIAFQGFPKPKYTFFGQNCIILKAHICKGSDTALLTLDCSDGTKIAVDELQPEGKRPMDAKSFLNGYDK